MANASLETRDLEKMQEITGNLYESIGFIGKRANQLSVKTKEELNAKLVEFATTVDNLEEIFENREQIEISKFYERMPKPASVATDEFLEERLTGKYREEEEEK